MGNSEGSLSDLSVDRENGRVYEDWLMAPGRLQGTPVTVFSASHPTSSRKRPYIEKALQGSKVFRHPGLLKYIDGGIVGSEVVVVTECATPLYSQDLTSVSPLQITAGLSAIIDTLIFLHDRAGVSHNNVNTSTIFLTSEGLWKLWGLEYSCSFSELNHDHIEHINNYCSEKCIPPDDKTQISPAYQHARDSYAFAKLVDKVLSYPQMIAGLPSTSEFLDLIRNCGLNPDWSKRPRLVTLADHNFFRHDFLKLHHDLTNVLLLSHNQRETFLKSLAKNLEQYPEDLVSNTMGGSLLTRPLMLIPTAATYLIPAVLKPKSSSGKESSGNSGLFSEETFKRSIIPVIIRLYNVHDATVRCILLTHLPSYVHLLPKDILANELLPELLLGIRDNNDQLVSATLLALAHLVPILGANIVIGSNRQHLFTTAKPKVCSGVCGDLVRRHSTASTRDARNDRNARGRTKSFNESEWKKSSNNASTISAVSNDPDVNSLDNLDLDTLSISQIPERSSPDGGEDGDVDLGLPSSTSRPDEDTEVWSDWEEQEEQEEEEVLNGQPLLDIVEKLKAMNSEKVEVLDQSAYDEMFKHDTFSECNKMEWQCTQYGIKIKSKEKRPKSNGMCLDASKIKRERRDSLAASYRTEMDVRSHTSKDSLASYRTGTDVKSHTSQGFGEEYDIMAIKVKKKHDSELDLFADLAPNFQLKKYDLEMMLEEAKIKSDIGSTLNVSTVPSISATLASLEIPVSQEVEHGWGVEEDWPEEDFSISPAIPTDSLLIKNENLVVSPETLIMHNISTQSSISENNKLTKSDEKTNGTDEEWNQEF